MVPRDLVVQRRNIIHPVDDGHILVEVKVLAQLLETGMQIADVWHRIDDGLTIERQNQSQRGVCRRMLRTKVQRPEIFLVWSVEFGEIRYFEKAIIVSWTWKVVGISLVGW